MTRTALILGASGRFGRHASRAFKTAGWDVRHFNRATGDLDTEVQNVDIVVNAWNPPDYTTWARDLLPMHKRVIAAMKHSDATVIIPGNVYVFGARTPTPWSERTAHNAVNPLGKLRIEMEAAYRGSGVKTVILRGGDFLDTEASGNWFDLILTKRLTKGVFTYPGRRDVPHAWAYLPDMARAAVLLASQRDTLPRFADVPFPGFTLTGEELAEALARVTGRAIKTKSLAWPLIAALSLVMPTLRGPREMRYLWDTPHSLDGAQLEDLLPGFTPTPLEDALRQATAHMQVEMTKDTVLA